MVEATKTVTAEELLRLPPDGFRYELIHGELARMTPAGVEHGRIAALVLASLLQHVRVAGLGEVLAAETGFLLAADPDHVRAPDVAFVRRERIERQAVPQAYFQGAPDLAVEVLSPSDTFSEVEEKVLDWLRYGTRMVLVINPKKRSATVYRSASQIQLVDEHGEIDGADVVPGWRMPMRELFA